MKLQEKEYEKIFDPKTLGKLKGQSQQAYQARVQKSGPSSGRQLLDLLNDIAAAEEGNRDELEQLAVQIVKDNYPIVDKYNINIDAKIEDADQNTTIPKGEFADKPDEGGYSPEEKEDMDAKRRLVNALSQGAGVRGSRTFVLMKDYLDSIDSSLIDKYTKALDMALGQYDDETAVARVLSRLASSDNLPGGSSLPKYDKDKKQWTVVARAINFPILVHEIVKGIYSVIGSRGWSKNKALNQATVASVDKLKNEPEDLRYGKFMLDAIGDAINKFYNKSNISDPYVRDIFIAKLVELPYPQLRDFIQNAINGELNAGQEKWAKDTISKISSLKETKINKPNQYDDYTEELIEFFKKDTLFKGFDKILINNYSKILDNVWEWYEDNYKEYDDEESEDFEDIKVPQNKNELLTKPTGGTTDSFYRVINGFLFPYMAVYLKKKDWDWEEDTEFSKNGKTVDMFDYIKPFEEYDTSPKEMSWSSFIEYLNDNWYNIPLKEIKINPPNTQKFKIGDKVKIISQPKWKGEIGNYPVNEPDKIKRIDGEYVYAVVIDRPGRRPHMVVSDWFKESELLKIELKETRINKPGPYYIIVHNDGTDEIYNLHHFIAPTYEKFREEFEDMFDAVEFYRDEEEYDDLSDNEIIDMEIDSKLYLICKDKDEYNDIVNMIERDDSDLEELDDEFKSSDETIWKIWPKPKHL
jgi:hypothetical protein